MLGSFLTDLLRRAIAGLERSGAEYALCGGIATVLSGRDRSTRDLDVLVWTDGEGLGRLRDALRDQGFAHHDRADRHRLEDVLLLRFWLPVGATGLSASLDVQVARGEFHRQVILNARSVSLLGHEVRLASPEDLILLKLAAFRPIDRADAIELAQLYHERLDRAYLEEQSRRLGVAERLREIFE